MAVSLKKIDEKYEAKWRDLPLFLIGCCMLSHLFITSLSNEMHLCPVFALHFNLKAKLLIGMMMKVICLDFLTLLLLKSGGSNLI